MRIMMKKPIIAVLLFVLGPSFSFGQHKKEIEAKNSIAFVQGITMIPSIKEEGVEGEAIGFINSYGLNYHRMLNHKWGVSWMNDLEVGEYFVTNKEDILKRENAFVSALTAHYHIAEGLEVFAGPGYEWERHKNLFVFRMGVEYQMLVANEWFLGPELFFDFKEKYHSWTLGLLIVKHF